MMAASSATVLPRRLTTSSATGLLVYQNDERTVTLKLKQALTVHAEELEEMVTELAALRARMSPSFPAHPPPLNVIEPCCSPRHFVASDQASGSTLIFIRHHLFGWIAISQSRKAALAMLRGVAADMETAEPDSH